MGFVTDLFDSNQTARFAVSNYKFKSTSHNPLRGKNRMILDARAYSFVYFGIYGQKSVIDPLHSWKFFFLIFLCKEACRVIHLIGLLPTDLILCLVELSILSYLTHC